MDKEKENRKLLRVYIKPDIETEVAEWVKNQQNVSISIKTLIRMAVAIQGTRDVLTLPFGVNALSVPVKAVEQANKEPQKVSVAPKNNENENLSDIRSAYYGSSQENQSENKNDIDDMDIFGTL